MQKTYFYLVAFLSVVSAALLLLACGGKTSAKVESLTGAGATFPFPLYSQMFDAYRNAKKVTVNYQSIGSGGGIRQIRAGTVDFGATDAFVSDAILAELEAENKTLLHVPAALGAVVVTYNLPGLTETIRFDGRVLAEVFNGKITRWNDPQLVQENAFLGGVDQPIIIIRRSDGSGTTFTFSDFLAQVSPAWRQSPGVGKSLDWVNTSVGAKGNEGVTAQVKATPYSIGYVSLNYALEGQLPVAMIKNAMGNFISPSVESVSKAADTPLPPDTRVALTSTSGNAESYPISTFTWIVFYQDQNYQDRTPQHAAALKELLTWMVTEGQEYNAPLYYAPLPPAAVTLSKKIIDRIEYVDRSY